MCLGLRNQNSAGFPTEQSSCQSQKVVTEHREKKWFAFFAVKVFTMIFCFSKEKILHEGQRREPAEANNFLLASLKFETVISLPFQRIIKIGWNCWGWGFLLHFKQLLLCEEFINFGLKVYLHSLLCGIIGIYLWKYPKSNLMYLLGIVCCQHLHQSQIQCWVLIWMQW